MRTATIGAASRDVVDPELIRVIANTVRRYVTGHALARIARAAGTRCAGRAGEPSGSCGAGVTTGTRRAARTGRPRCTRGARVAGTRRSRISHPACTGLSRTAFAPTGSGLTCRKDAAALGAAEAEENATEDPRATNFHGGSVVHEIAAVVVRRMSKRSVPAFSARPGRSPGRPRSASTLGDATIDAVTEHFWRIETGA